MREIVECSVCVVGGAGFLGSHLVAHLVEDRNCSVLVLDNLSAGRREHLHPAAKFEHCDITKSEGQLLNFFCDNDVDYVFNYAAVPYIPVSFDRPLHVFDVNAVGAIHVINAAQQAGCKGVLQVSSAELYGEADGAISEDAPVRPRSSYGASKAAVDAYVQVRWMEAATKAIALRQFNCVGERETHPYVVPEIVSQLAQQTGPERVVKLGNNSRRDFMYAGDAVRLAVKLLERGDFGEVYNLGSERAVHVYDLVPMIAEHFGCTARVEIDPERERPWEIWHLQSDNAKVRGAVGSFTATPLEHALRLTVEDFRRRGRWSWQ